MGEKLSDKWRKTAKLFSGEAWLPCEELEEAADALDAKDARIAALERELAGAYERAAELVELCREQWGDPSGSYFLDKKTANDLAAGIRALKDPTDAG